MKIVLDMDNTLIDEFGQGRRPGAEAFLERLAADGHELALWTSSTKERALLILRHLDLERHFAEFRFREDYDPDNRGLGKNINEIGGHVLIDDDPKQIAHMKKIRRRGILVPSYRTGGEEPEPGVFKRVYKELNQKRGLLGLFRR